MTVRRTAGKLDPHETAPHKTAPHKTAPHKTAPHKTAPHKTAPHKTASHETAPGLAAPVDPAAVGLDTVDVARGGVLPLYTPAQAAGLLAVPESWLRRRAGERAVPSTRVGKHLRFSRADLAAIASAGARPAITAYRPPPPAGRRSGPTPAGPGRARRGAGAGRPASPRGRRDGRPAR